MFWANILLENVLLLIMSLLKDLGSSPARKNPFHGAKNLRGGVDIALQCGAIGERHYFASVERGVETRF